MENSQSKQGFVDRDLLIRLDEKVGIFLTEFKHFVVQMDERLEKIELGKASAQTQKDHESRIRRLEMSSLIAIGFLYALQAYLQFFRH